MTRSVKWIEFYHCRREVDYVFLSVSDWVQLFSSEFFGFEWTSLFPDLLSSPAPCLFPSCVAYPWRAGHAWLESWCLISGGVSSSKLGLNVAKPHS